MNELSFIIEKRETVDVMVFHRGGCRPANIEEVEIYEKYKSDRALLEEAFGLLEWCRHHAGYILYPIGVSEKEHNEQMQKIDLLLLLISRAKEVLK